MAQAALQRDSILELDPKPNRALVLVTVQAMGQSTERGSDVSGNQSATATDWLIGNEARAPSSTVSRGNPAEFYSTSGSGTTPVSTARRRPSGLASQVA
jgi:hypothetical protein